MELIDILVNLLNFNPYLRMTAYECLTECKIFDEVRDRKKELALFKMRQQKSFIVELPIDSWDAFDYENANNAKYTVADLKKMMKQEIL